MRYVISYDLLIPGQPYHQLTDALRQLGAERILLSQWIVRRTGTSAMNLLTYLRPHIDTNDRLLVMCMDSGDAAWTGNLMADPNRI